MEGISRVKDAVTTANDQVDQAQRDAQARLEAKVQEQDELYASKRASFIQEGQAMVDEARSQAEKEAEATLAQGDKRSKEVLSVSGSKMERAAATIVERIVNMNGNS